MSYVNENQPLGTPTWIDLSVPDVAQAKDFYRAMFGWEYADPAGPRTECLLHGRPVAGLTESPGTAPVSPAWVVYLATDDCDATVRKALDAGAFMDSAPEDVPDVGRLAVLRDPVGARVGLWEGRGHPGCQVVNEPDALIRNDLVTATPEPAREFYAAVFSFTLDTNPDLPGVDFTFLRRPDGHEIGGVMGDPEIAASAWGTAFAVADTDAAVKLAQEAGGQASTPVDHVYARMASITDPFGTTFEVGSTPST